MEIYKESEITVHKLNELKQTLPQEAADRIRRWGGLGRANFFAAQYDPQLMPAR